MSLPPFALFVISDTITVDHLNRVLTDELSYGSHLLAPVVEPDLSRPYSATPRLQYDSAGEILPPAEFPPPVSADTLTPAKNPFIGATLKTCAAYLRDSASVDTRWDTQIFAVLDEQYITHGTILVAHSYVAGDTTNYFEWNMPHHDGVQAYPVEKGKAMDHLSLRTGIDFQEDLARYQRVSKSSGREDRSIGFAWELFHEDREDRRPV